MKIYSSALLSILGLASYAVPSAQCKSLKSSNRSLSSQSTALPGGAYVFTTTYQYNGAGNQILIYRQNETGSLTLQGTPSTGSSSLGVEPNQATGSILNPITSSSDGLIVFVGTPDGVLSYEVSTGQMRLTSGSSTSSMAFCGNRLYALSETGSFEVYSINQDHGLQLIEGSKRYLVNGVQPDQIVSTQIAHTSDCGQVVINFTSMSSTTGDVVARQLAVFGVNSKTGIPDEKPVTTHFDGTLNDFICILSGPDNTNFLVISNAGTNTLSSSQLNANGTLGDSISKVSTGAQPSSFTVSGRSGRILYSANQSGISSYSINADFSMTPLDPRAAVWSTVGGSAVTLVAKNDYLFVLHAGRSAPSIGVHYIEKDGSLTLVGEYSDGLTTRTTKDSQSVSALLPVGLLVLNASPGSGNSTNWTISGNGHGRGLRSQS